MEVEDAALAMGSGLPHLSHPVFRFSFFICTLGIAGRLTGWDLYISVVRGHLGGTFSKEWVGQDGMGWVWEGYQ